MSGHLPLILLNEPFQPEDSLARRADPKHVTAMAVLAYTNMWDRLINNLVLGKRDFVKREDERGVLSDDEYAQRLAPVFAFFAPLESLNAVSSVETEFTDESIALRIEPGLQAFGRLRLQSPACQLHLKIASGSRSVPELSSTLVRDIVNKVILRAIRGHYPPMWDAMLNSLKFQLVNALRPLEPILPDRAPLVLYHGCNVDRGTSVQAKLDELSTVFVSTTDQYGIATFYAHWGAHDEGDREVWVFKLELEEKVEGVHVDSVLSSTWQCWSAEHETVLGPGTGFALKHSEPTTDENVRVWTVRVSAPPCETHGSPCPKRPRVA
jgi:hypothetical protein